MIPFLEIISGALASAGVGTVIFQLISYLKEKSKKQIEADSKIKSIDQQIEKDPQNVGYAWYKAREKLVAYFDINLTQLNLIFWISLISMIIGLCLIVFGITRSITSPQIQSPAYISAISGIITEFISATFIVVYRATLKEGRSNVLTLEKINSVGTAIQILDSIPEEDELKNKTRSDFVKLLLSFDKDIKS